MSLKLIERTELLQRVDRYDSRLVRIIAPAGYGKTVLAEQIAGRSPLVASCDFLGAAKPIDLAKRVLAALAGWLGAEGPQILMAAATSDNDLATWMRLTETAWTSSSQRGALILDNAELAVAAPDLLDPLAALFRRPLPTRMVVVCSREQVNLRTGRFASPTSSIAFNFADLRFSHDEIAQLLKLPQAEVAAIAAYTDGWPIAVQLVARLREGQEPARVDALLSTVAFKNLYDYLAEQVLGVLPQALRELVQLVASIPQCTLADLKALRGPHVVHDIALLEPFVRTDGAGAVAIHPLVKHTIARETPLAGTVVRSAASAALTLGQHERAAQLYFASGDIEQCADTLEASGLHITGPTPNQLDLTLALPEETVSRHPMLWCTAMFLSRSLGADKYKWVLDAESFWHTQQRDASLAARGMMFVVLCNGYMNIGEFGKGLALIESFADSLSPEERELVKGPIAGAKGMLTVPADAANDLTAIERDAADMLAVPATRALWRYEITSRFHRVNGERDAERVALANAVELGLELRLPLVICATTLEATFASWFAGDDDLSDHYGVLLERNVIPSTIGGCRPMLDVLAGRYDTIEPATAKKKSLSYAYVMAAARDKRAEARIHFARSAIAAADQSNQPFARIVSRIAMSSLVPTRRTVLLEEAVNIATNVVPERLRLDTSRVARGEAQGTMFDAFLNRLEPRKLPRKRDEGAYRLSALAGTLECDRERIELRRREFEICLFLAFRGRPVKLDEIAETLWDGARSAGNTIKVHVSRIRKAVSDDFIRSTPAGYTLTERLRFDLAELKELVRDFRRAQLLDSWERSAVDKLVSWLSALRAAQNQGSIESWVGAEFYALEADLTDTLVAGARDALAHHRYDAALAIGEQLVAIDRCDEYAVEVCIRAAMGQGETFAARRYLRDYGTHLNEDMKAEVSPALTALIRGGPEARAHS